MGGLNTAVLNGQQSTVLNPTTAGTMPGTTGTLPAARQQHSLPSRVVFSRCGYTGAGASAAQPGTVNQGMGPFSPGDYQRPANEQRTAQSVRPEQQRARTAPASTTSTAPAAATFNPGTGVPGTGISTPGTIVQGSGNPAEQAGQPNLNADAFNRLYSDLGTAQTAIPGVTGLQPDTCRGRQRR